MSADINTLAGPVGSFRQPRVSVKVNGIVATDAVKSCEVKTNNYFAADTFDIELSLRALPPALNAAFWANTQALIELSMDSGNGMIPLITGNADTLDIDIIHGTVKATGRDLTSVFIDTKSETKYQNMTSSQIAQALAASHGLSASVTATSTPAGRYYEIDHARLTTNIPEWQLLNYLAEEEGFDVYVQGNTLYFNPSAPAGQSGLVLQYRPGTAGTVQSGNFIDLQMRRSMTLAKDVIVKVVSHNVAQQKAFTATAKRNGTGGSPYSGNAQVYTFKVPGLTPDQAQSLANAKMKEISLHERVVEATIPGETGLQPRQMVTLTGTQTAFDQDYYVDEITRRIGWDGGFISEIRMKNHSPESTVSA